jgi:ribokinase
MFSTLDEVKINSIVVMPDFFVDRILKLTSQEEFSKVLAEKVKFGGGSLRNISTTERKGGNAVNIAYCLGKLGIRTTLFTVADELGSLMLQKVFGKFGDTVSLKIGIGKHGRTTGLEFLSDSNNKTKVMLNDAGDNEHFGPNKIESKDNLKILENADAVMIVNWGSNLRGTELAQYVFKKSPNSFHYIAPADIEIRKEEFRNFLLKCSNQINDVSLNENEAISLGKSLGMNSLLPNDYGEHDVKNAAMQISSKVGINIEVHTRNGAGWSNGTDSQFGPAIKVQPKTLTGAGDSWDSANIVGYLCKLSPITRLMFANACASLYVQSSDAEPPTMEKTLELLHTKVGY